MEEWEDLVKTEPALACLLEEIRRADRMGPRFCGVTAWYGLGGRPGFKMRMYRLVGFGSSKPELRTMDAYETAMRVLYDALPPCRGRCSCNEGDMSGNEEVSSAGGAEAVMGA